MKDTPTYTEDTADWCDPCSLPRAECGHPFVNRSGLGEQHRGQTRIAYRLAEDFTGRLLFVRGIGWHVWDGHRWARDEKDRATMAVLDTLRIALSESLNDNDLRADVRKCESANGIRGVLEIAASLPSLRAATDELDADPYLINVANGTLDLRTRELHDPDPADRITRVCRGAYTPEADATEWLSFLATVIPDPDERDYLRRVVGHAVYGAVREHLFPVLVGSGGNGKGTFYGAIVNAMGDYAIVFDPSMLMDSERGAGGPEMMQLFGARLAVGSETEEGRRLNAAVMKRLSGGDRLNARNLYEPPVIWTPTHQLIYVTNHLPRVKGADKAIWRRMRVIPFDVEITDEQKDTQIDERLELAADAVITWAIEGWFDYCDRGAMGEPDTVQNATGAYQVDSDPVKRFTLEECIIGSNVYVTTRRLFEAWNRWIDSEGGDRLTEKEFARQLDGLGFDGKRTKTGKIRTGIGLPSEDSEEGRR